VSPAECRCPWSCRSIWWGGRFVLVAQLGQDEGERSVHVVIIFDGVVVRFQKGVGVLGDAVLGVRELQVRPGLRPVFGAVRVRVQGAMEGGRGARV
jgi:hypothetical protein